MNSVSKSNLAAADSHTQAYLLEASYHQGVAALHAEMARDWVQDGSLVLATIAQRFADLRYAAARDCVDGAGETEAERLNRAAVDLRARNQPGDYDERFSN